MIHEAVGGHCGDRPRGSVHPSVLVQVQEVATNLIQVANEFATEEQCSRICGTVAERCNFLATKISAIRDFLQDGYYNLNDHGSPNGGRHSDSRGS